MGWNSQLLVSLKQDQPDTLDHQEKCVMPAFQTTMKFVLSLFCVSTFKKQPRQVSNLRSPKPLFVTSRKPIRRAKPGTISHWVKDTLRLAGINTEVFSAHSTRGVSTSWTATRGVLIGDILRAANWSSRSTFEQLYYCPSTSATFLRTIFQSTQDERYFIAV